MLWRTDDGTTTAQSSPQETQIDVSELEEEHQAFATGGSSAEANIVMQNAINMIGYTTEANGKGADKDTVRFISIIEPTTLEPGGTSSGDDYIVWWQQTFMKRL